MRSLLPRFLLVVACMVTTVALPRPALPVAVLGAQETSLFPFADATGKWGYIDRTGQTVVPPRFDRAEPFSEGLALVGGGGRYGFIDPTGALIIPATFPDAFSADQRQHGADPRFSEGLALVAVGTKYGYIDRTGKLVFTVDADQATTFSNGRAAVRVGKKYGFIDTTGAMVIPPQYAFAGAFSEGVAAVVPDETPAGTASDTLIVQYIDPSGNVVFSVPWTVTKGTGDGLILLVSAALLENEARLSGGRALFLRGAVWGYVDVTGAEVIAPRFPLAQPFSEGLAVAVEGEKWGYIDPTGAFAISPRFNTSGFPFFHGAARFSGGLAAVRSDDPFSGTFGYIDRTGALVIPEQYAAALPFADGLALVVDDDGKGSAYVDARGNVVWHSAPATATLPSIAPIPESFIDHSGTVVFSVHAEDVRAFSGGLAAVKMNGKWGFLDKTGAVVIAAQYASVNDFAEGRARVSDGKQWGWIDTTGRVIIPLQYARTGAFVGGRTSVSDGMRWGWIDTNGDTVIPIQFANVGDFAEGLAPVKVGAMWGYIDMAGAIVISPQWDEASTFSNGLAVVRMKSGGGAGMAGYIDRTGKVVIPLQYADARDFVGDRAAVQQDGKWGFVDRSGTLVVPPQFEGNYPIFFNGLAQIKVHGLYGFVDATGTTIVPPQYQEADFGFSAGLAAVRNSDGKWGYIDATGTLVIGFQFDSASAFSEGAAVVEQGRHEECVRKGSSETCTTVGNMGYIDRTGKAVIPLQFTRAESFSEGLALVNRPSR